MCVCVCVRARACVQMRVTSKAFSLVLRLVNWFEALCCVKMWEARWQLLRDLPPVPTASRLVRHEPLFPPCHSNPP